MWSKLPEAEKSAYQARAAKSREKYQAALAEYNANKKAAAKADAAPAAEGPPKKKRRKSEDGSEKKKVLRFSVKTKAPSPTFTVLRSTQKKKSKKSKNVEPPAENSPRSQDFVVKLK